MNVDMPLNSGTEPYIYIYIYIYIWFGAKTFISTFTFRVYFHYTSFYYI